LEGRGASYRKSAPVITSSKKTWLIICKNNIEG
jgi:hypothetical protein